MKVDDVVLRELSIKCAEMANENLNELIEFTCKSLINHNNFKQLSIEELTYLYKTIMGGYIKGLEKAFEHKIIYALGAVNDPAKLAKAFNDPEFQKFVNDIHDGR